VAALRKWKVSVPNDPKELHELDLEEYAKAGKFRIDSTPTLRFATVAVRVYFFFSFLPALA
jgi:peptide/histidine transporter 3/4